MEKSGGLLQMITGRYEALWEWVKPKSEDALLMKMIKTFFKGLLALILVLLSPVIILVLTLVFFAAI